MLRFVIPAVLLGLPLLGCATPAGTAPTVETPVVGAAAPPPSRAAILLSQAGRADAPSLAAIEREIGAPDISRRDGAGATITYRLENCALMLLFAADAQNELRLVEAHPSARRAGEAAPTLDQCAGEASARAPS